MNIQRLGWAGIRIDAADTCLLVDPVENFDAGRTYVPGMEQMHYPFSEQTRADAVLLTHLHPDHYDPELIRRCLTPHGHILCSRAIEGKLQRDGWTQLTALDLNEPFETGPFSITPVFAMDGLGDEQVSWVIEQGGHRVFHGGDTIWHSRFWEIGKRFGSFGAAFLPVNGVVQYLKKPFSPIPATLTPEQAIVASRLLNAASLIPIHYGVHAEGVYEEYPDALPALRHFADKHAQPLQELQAGDVLSFS